MKLNLDTNEGRAERYVSEITRRSKEVHRVEISDFSIQSAVRGDWRRCVLGRSVVASIPGATRPYVTAEYIRFNLRGYRYQYETPRKVASLAAKFDEGENVVRWPSFELTGAIVRLSEVAPASRRDGKSARSKNTSSTSPRKAAPRSRWRGL